MATKKTTPAVQDHNDCVIIELDRPRTLKLKHSVMKRFSALRKCSVFELGDELSTYDGIAAMAYCMLAADDPDLTVDEVDRLLDDADMLDVIQKVSEAVQLAFPDAEGNDETPPAAAGTGE